jgi:beta-aspartyl-peptidase (threonine type)
MENIAIALHGGAGTIRKSSMTPEKEAAFTAALEAALQAGFSLLDQGKSAVEAVERAVIILENSPLFNAGRGSVFTADGTHEMDASIMEGKNLQAGAVSLVRGIKNPVSLARFVMERSEHVFLAGPGAEAFAREMGCAFEPEGYFFDDFRYRQWQEIRGTDITQLDHSESGDEKFGTVGAVALDAEGNLAAATSTGGLTNKKYGRIGDSPVIGAGTYANNNSCAVSCTGTGEFFIRGVVAYDVSCLMEYKGMSLEAACHEVIHKRVMGIGGDGGLIAIDRSGNIAMPFNSEGMYRGLRRSNGEGGIWIYGEG